VIILWTEKSEEEFFTYALNIMHRDQLFYQVNDSYYAYWPKSYKGDKTTLQSRNSIIGQFTENFSRNLIENCVKDLGLFAVQSAICDEIGLTRQSPGDVVIAKINKQILNPSDILCVVEVKMSIVWNWMIQNNQLSCVGDYNTHTGNPGLLRSDTMLKAIGKSINIRVSGVNASSIPIIILGNTPISKSYYSKVDYLQNAGIIQGFYSINPKPLTTETLENTPYLGFQRFNNFDAFKVKLNSILKMNLNYFSSMKDLNELGNIIEIASKELANIDKAKKFLTLLRKPK
jgi:hypothetical protein